MATHSKRSQRNTNSYSSDEEEEDTSLFRQKHFRKRPQLKHNKLTFKTESISPDSFARTILPWTELASDTSGYEHILDPVTYNLTDPTELDCDTTSTTIVMWSDDEVVEELGSIEGAARQPRHILDENQSQNQVNRPRSRSDSVKNRCAPRLLHSSLISFDQEQVDGYDHTHANTVSQHLNPETGFTPQIYQPARLAISPTHSSPKRFAKDSDISTGRWGLKVRTIQPNVPESRIQRDSRETLIQVGEINPIPEMTISVKLLDELESSALQAPVPETMDLLDWAQTRYTETHKLSQHWLYRVYQLHQARNVRSEMCSGLVIPLVVNALRSPSPSTEWVDEILDTANPSILSPIVDVDFVRPVVPTCVQLDQAEPESQRVYLHHTIETEKKSAERNSCRAPVMRHLPPESNWPERMELATTLGPSKKRFRRRVKISLHQCPAPSECESHSLIVRLSIDPMSDSESVRSQSLGTKKSPSSLRRIISPLKHAGPVQLRYDSLNPEETGSWIPINYHMRVMSPVPSNRPDYREQYTGIAECLITSLSSLSIPMNEIESIDSSFSWSLLEPIRTEGRGGKTVGAPDAVVVEIRSDEEGKRTKQLSPTGSDSEVYQLGVDEMCEHGQVGSKTAQLPRNESLVASKRSFSASARSRQRSQASLDRPTPVTKSARFSSGPALQRHTRRYITHAKALDSSHSRFVLSSSASAETRSNHPSLFKLGNDHVLSCGQTMCLPGVQSATPAAQYEVYSSVVNATTESTGLAFCHPDAVGASRNQSDLPDANVKSMDETTVNLSFISGIPIALESVSTEHLEGDEGNACGEPVKNKPGTHSNHTESTKFDGRLRQSVTGCHVNPFQYTGYPGRSVLKSVPGSHLHLSARSKLNLVRTQKDPSLIKPTDSLIIGSEFHARSLLPREKPLFRPGEMTITEFEDFRRRANPKQRHRAGLTHLYQSNTADSLNPIGSEAHANPVEVFTAAHRTSKFAFCFRRQCSRDNRRTASGQAQASKQNEVQTLEATRPSTQRRTLFGFRLNPEPECASAMVSHIYSK